ncbi:phage major capsid protein [Paracoccus sp. (in: a-proteobacteria)]|uniref:phage major capsid protein n=1 Tax=Paracoccus sp. TaxID=267 RepID=UPI0028A5B4A2|nr:phage major capsid protein [Paracoccus sp. (in: a-proteobacteria)]
MKHPVRGITFARAEGGNAVVAELNKAFAAFKEGHAEELAGIKAKFDDVVTTEKLGKIEAAVSNLTTALDEANAKIAGISLNGGGTDDGLTDAEREYTAAFAGWFRTGEGERSLKSKAREGGVKAAYSVGSEPDGGYTAPIEWDRTITDQRVEVSPMRRYASVQSVSGQGFKKLYNLRGTDAAWVGETAGRPQTDGSKLAEYEFSFGEIYAMPAATERILEDSEIDIAGWLAGEVNTEFARQEGLAFINGDGVNKPKGLLMFDATAEAALPAAQRHPLGPVAEVVTGAAAALTPDGLIDLIYDMPEDRSTGAALYANRKTHAIIRKMKDGDGNYLWQPPFQAGQPAQVLGTAVHELSGLPDVAAGAIPVVYGNMAEGYRIFDRVGMSVLRDPYTNKPYILFYTRKRVGGGLWNPEWLRYHRVAAA